MARMTARGIKLTRADVTAVRKLQLQLSKEMDVRFTWADAARSAMRKGLDALLKGGV